ncbi:MAG TPA: DUF4403 family protein [Xanthobacteraceae bacterium]|nr:DUF4403 family protein [Xanthobacteraceae bacterium]
MPSLENRLRRRREADMRKIERNSNLSARSLAVAAAALILAAAAVIAVPHDRTEAAVVSKKRPVAAAQPAAKPARKDSKLELSLDVPLAKISSIVNQQSFQIENSGKALGFQYEMTIFLDKLALSTAPGAEHLLVVKTDFHFEGHISGRNVQGTGSGTLPLTVNIGPDWCPIVEVGTPVIQWGNLDVPGPVKFVLNSQLFQNIIAKEAAKLADCNAIKSRLAAVWQTFAWQVYSTAGAKKSKATTYYLNISPSDISITGLAFANDRVSVQVVLAAATYVDQQPGKKQTIPLPNPGLSAANAKDGDREIKLQLIGDIAVGPP